LVPDAYLPPFFDIQTRSRLADKKTPAVPGDCQRLRVFQVDTTMWIGELLLFNQRRLPVAKALSQAMA
jgi:hypothetical protein